uniref:SWIM-type domain-containing protein n=1 Tax=Lactuca sativa TaxID=4236 RepID=A0A9R1V7H1_LACSA|nr:hypothetical protein LSAT_V11C600337260 [Lactuca sativa]
MSIPLNGIYSQQLILKISGVTKMLTCLSYKEHVAKVYTHKVFYQVQLKIVQYQKSCFQMSVTSIESVDTFLILERHKPITTTEQVNVNEGNVEEYHYDKIFKVSQYTVTCDRQENLLYCSCKNFKHVGIICRHIFCVFHFYSYDKIPNKYRRLNADVAVNVDKTAIDISSTVDQCISFLSHEQVKQEEYLVELKKLKTELVVDYPM